MKNYILIIFYFLFSGIMMAQSAADDFKLLMESYSTMKNYNVHMEYSFYGDSQKKPVETMDAIVQQFGEKYYFKLGGLEQVSDKNTVITINSTEKYVINDKAGKYENTQSGLAFNEILKEIQKDGRNIQLEKKRESTYLLNVYEANEKSPSWTILYDRSTYRMEAITLYFGEEETAGLYGDEFKTSHIEIVINHLIPSEPALQTDSIIAKTGKSITLKAKYKNYTFYDLSAQN